jgi:hypothetical protein
MNILIEGKPRTVTPQSTSLQMEWNQKFLRPCGHCGFQSTDNECPVCGTNDEEIGFGWAENQRFKWVLTEEEADAYVDLLEGDPDNMLFLGLTSVSLYQDGKHTVYDRTDNKVEKFSGYGMSRLYS